MKNHVGRCVNAVGRTALIPPPLQFAFSLWQAPLALGTSKFGKLGHIGLEIVAQIGEQRLDREKRGETATHRKVLQVLTRGSIGCQKCWSQQSSKDQSASSAATALVSGGFSNAEGRDRIGKSLAHAVR